MYLDKITSHNLDEYKQKIEKHVTFAPQSKRIAPLADNSNACNRAIKPVERKPQSQNQAAANSVEPDGKKLPLKDLLKLPNVDKQMVEIILDEIVQNKNVKFSDISKRLYFELIQYKVFYI